MSARNRSRLLVALGVAACPAALAAQAAPPGAVDPRPASVSAARDARQAVAAGAALEVHALALGGVTAAGGVTPNPDSVHYAGGAIVQVTMGALGAMGLGMLGRGADYESTLVGGALSFRVLTIGRFELTAFGGYGRYAEVGWTGIRRDARGPLFGGLAVLRTGGLAIGAAFTDLTGRYEGADVREPFGFHVPRVSIGLGF